MNNGKTTERTSAGNGNRVQQSDKTRTGSSRHTMHSKTRKEHSDSDPHDVTKERRDVQKTCSCAIGFGLDEEGRHTHARR